MENKMKNEWKDGKKYLLLYFTSLIIPALFILIAYTISYNVAKKNEVDKQVLVLEQAMQNMDQRLDTMETISKQLADNPKVVGYFNNPPSINGIYPALLIELRKQLYDYSLTSNFPFEYFIIFKNSEVVINPKYIYTVTNFQKNYLVFDGMTKDEFHEIFIEATHYNELLPARKAVINDSEKDVLTFLTTIKQNFKNVATVLFVLDDTIISEMMEQIGVMRGGYVYIENENGVVLASSANEGLEIAQMNIPLGDNGSFNTKINGKPMLVTFAVSENTKWRYVSVQPYDIVMSPVNNLRNLAIVIIGIAIIAGLFIAAGLAINHAASVNVLMQDKEKLNRYVEEQMPYVQFAQLNKLLRGNFDPEDLNDLSYFIDKNADLFNVAVIQLIGRIDFYDKKAEELEKIEDDHLVNLIIISKMIDELFYERFPKCYSLCEISKDKLAVIFFYNHEQADECIKNDINRIADGLNELGFNRWAISIGKSCDDMLDISASYHHAENILSTKLITNGSILWYSEDDISRNDNPIYYPDNIYFRMERYLKTGNKEGVQEVLNEIYMNNFEQSEIPPTLQKILIHKIIFDLNAIFISLEIDENIRLDVIKIADSNVRSIGEIYNSIISVCDASCEFMSAKRIHKKSAVADEIKMYIDENYTESNLSITLIARKFNMSETYVSLIFKEAFSYNCSNYIQQVRMEKAYELLKNSSFPIKEICVKVGYNSINTFNKAFKRIYSVTPSSLR